MNLFAILLFSYKIFSVYSAPRRSSATVLDCTRRDADGLYARGCSSKFMRCYNGKQYDYTCPKKLKFNVETAKCEHRRQVIACINNMDNDQVVVKADEPFDCSKKKDGVYGSGKCSTTYYHCSRGHSSEMICPAGLYYNDKLKGCDDVDSVDECDVLTALRGFDERRESHLGAKGKYIERNLRSNSGGPIGGSGGYGGGTRSMSLGRAKGKGRRGGKTRRIRKAMYQANFWKPEQELNCTGMDDGDYATVYGQCSKHYWRCSGGETSGKTCDDGLFFNSASGKCDVAANIGDCKDITHESDKIPEAEEINEPDCALLEDGPLEHSACSALYFSCSSGQLLKLQCPPEQVYDAIQKRCDNPESVYSCRRNEEATSQETRIIPAPEIRDYCAANGDGFYSAGCENYFYLCSSDYSYRVNCPKGLFFESKTRICDYKDRVTQCNSESAGSAANEHVSDNSIKEQNTDQNPEKQDNKINETRRKIAMRTRASHIPEAAIPAAMAVPLPKAKDLPLLPDDFDCDHKPDGLYSIGCKSEYVTCVNNRIFFFECPSNLIFDEETRSCDYADNIVECSSRAFRKANNHRDETPLIKPRGTPRKISTANKNKRTKSDSIHSPDYCEKLNDGVYFEDCEREYVICSKQTGIIYNCPEGEIMDPVSKTCDEPRKIPKCRKHF